MIDQPLVPQSISLIVRMLSAVKLNGQSSLSANKVDRVRPDRLLTHKFESGE
ncbi:MAG: hypothetical protein OJF62_001370 [Pseudolabrys sp.]|nr:hypothetical protein [Pseudolabrys sp.]